MSAKPTAKAAISKSERAVVDDNPEWSDAELAGAQSFAKALPDLAAAIRRARGRQKAPTKALVTLRIDRQTLDAFKATGPGWQTRIGEALKRAAPSRR